MHKTVGMARLIGMAGSLRGSSYLSAVLSGLRENLLSAAQIEIFDLRLPFYNEDKDGPAAPEGVRAFRDAIRASDGVVIVTPEYNHGIPGVLKNALDWASGPSVNRRCLINRFWSSRYRPPSRALCERRRS